MRLPRKIMAGLAAGLLATSAQASVIYHFHADPGSSSTPRAQVTGGTLEVTDAAYRAGSVSVVYGPMISSDPRQSPILEVGLDINPASVGVRPRDPGFFGSSQSLDASLNFLDSGLLSGFMDIRADTELADASGGESGWSVGNYGSDYFIDPPCSGEDLCDVGTGYWQLDESTVPADVPEPPVWVLFGVAVIGLAGMQKRAKA